MVFDDPPLADGQGPASGRHLPVDVEAAVGAGEAVDVVQQLFAVAVASRIAGHRGLVVDHVLGFDHVL